MPVWLLMGGTLTIGLLVVCRVSSTLCDPLWGVVRVERAWWGLVVRGTLLGPEGVRLPRLV